MSKILGIDYGKKRIGLAVGDTGPRLATPYKILQNRGLGFVLQEIRDICEKDGIEKAVVGLPLRLDGSESGQTAETREFIRKLGEFSDIPIVIEDERLTTGAAKSVGSGKGERDHVAAMFILQSYLDKLPLGE